MIKKILSLFKKKVVTKAPPLIQQKKVINTTKKIKKVVHKKKQQPVAKKEEIQRKPIPQKEVKESVTKEENKWTPKDFPVAKEEGKTRFYDFKLSNGILHAIADLGFEYCTPIQAGILKSTLDGKDAIGRAQTGTGKTAAFLITAIAKLVKRVGNQKRFKASPRVLILAPTRELVQQIEKDALGLVKYQPIKVVAVFGGMDYKKQIYKIKGNYIDIMVATPGRLIDFMNQKIVHLNNVEILVLDEADRMLDMGFIPDVRKIERATPLKEKRQTLFFSATFPDSIKRFASSWTNDAVTVEIEPESIAADTVTQINYIVEADDKFKLLFNILEKDNATKILLFCNRKDTSKDLFEKMQQYGISVTLLTGDIDQRKRMNRLESFKEGKFKVLVATDVAGRGIHIEAVSHVINFNLPVDPEDYVHRIGRTGRAGLDGISISFACEDDSYNIPSIEEFMQRKLELVYPDDELFKELPAPSKTLKEIKELNKPPAPKKKYDQKNSKNSGRNRNGEKSRNHERPQRPQSKPNNNSSGVGK
ncbi:MAG: DEAD/DEAH box helicase [Melioribacteraceae bacterium]|jgi:ATP-dependent RNA helicase RhlB|nr:DEAD/DEAH box helicase [Melioribacteraceae bacterium]